MLRISKSSFCSNNCLQLSNDIYDMIFIVHNLIKYIQLTFHSSNNRQACEAFTMNNIVTSINQLRKIINIHSVQFWLKIKVRWMIAHNKNLNNKFSIATILVKLFFLWYIFSLQMKLQTPYIWLLHANYGDQKSLFIYSLVLC